MNSNENILYHFARNGANIGTWPLHQVANQINSGKILSTDHFYTEIIGEWRPVQELMTGIPSVSFKKINMPIPASKRKERVDLKIQIAVLMIILGGTILWIFWGR